MAGHASSHMPLAPVKGRPRRRSSRAARAAAMLLTPALVAASVAGATAVSATSTPPPSSTQHFTLNGDTGGSATASPAAAASDITCNSNGGQYPHKSTHVPGTINYVATVACDAPMSLLRITATIHPPIPLRLVTGTVGTGTVSAQSNAATTYCVSGKYYGTAFVEYYAPPGATPSYLSENLASPTVTITC